MPELETSVSLRDEDEVDVVVEFKVYYWGAPEINAGFEHSGRPEEPPEFSIRRVTRMNNGEDVTKLVDEKNINGLIFEWIEENR